MNQTVHKFLTLPLPPEGRTNWPWTEIHSSLPEALSDGSPWPKISVVTPSFNQGLFLEETIRSVLLQGYPGIEFIIVDGGSTDNSLDIIQKYEPWLAKWVSEPDRGQSHAVNKGIGMASGEILLWLNSDDLVLPGAFSTVARYFTENPQTKLVIGQAYVIDQNSVTAGEMHSHYSSWNETLLNPANSVRQVSTFFSRSMFTEYGLLDESLSVAMDTELLLRFMQAHEPLVIEQYLTAFRKHSDAKSFRYMLQGYREADYVRARYFPNQGLAAQYHVRSSKNWLNLSEMKRLGSMERIYCLGNSARINPSILFSRAFWSAVKKIALRL